MEWIIEWRSDSIDRVGEKIEMDSPDMAEHREDCFDAISFLGLYETALLRNTKPNGTEQQLLLTRIGGCSIAGALIYKTPSQDRVGGTMIDWDANQRTVTVRRKGK